MSMKNPLTPAGIKPATFRFVAQHLTHCATAVSGFKKVTVNFPHTSQYLLRIFELRNEKGEIFQFLS